MSADEAPPTQAGLRRITAPITVAVFVAAAVGVANGNTVASRIADTYSTYEA